MNAFTYSMAQPGPKESSFLMTGLTPAITRPTGATLALLVWLAGLSSPLAWAQVRVNDPAKAAERSVENRVNSRVNQGVDQGIGKVEDGIINIFRKKPKAKPVPANTPAEEAGQTDTDKASAEERPVERTAAKTEELKAPASLKAYQKFDFVPGEKVVAFDDFMQDAIGDFPDKWNSTGSGEIVTIEGKPGHWLMLNKKGEYLPEFINSLPDNFTMQFDLAANETFSFYSSYLWVNLVQLKNPAKDFMQWGRFPTPTEGVRVGLHPRSAGTQDGMGLTEFITYAKGEQLLKNETEQPVFSLPNQNMVKVSIWRQKQRLRVYLNEAKIWDVPRAFQPGVIYNGVVLSMGGTHKEEDRFYISNFRLAVGAPDTRNKLMTEGRFVTNGILFDVNSDKIKPESYGTLKDIAAVLTENADVRVQIIGHTDADGDEAANLALSKKRAAAVKVALSTTFSLDASRLETDGKGEAQPAGPNTTAAGKANNRRVEFVKL